VLFSRKSLSRKMASRRFVVVYGHLDVLRKRRESQDFVFAGREIVLQHRPDLAESVSAAKDSLRKSMAVVEAFLAFLLVH